jgi:hypothetical protein
MRVGRQPVAETFGIPDKGSSGQLAALPHLNTCLDTTLSQSVLLTAEVRMVSTSCFFCQDCEL